MRRRDLLRGAVAGLLMGPNPKALLPADSFETTTIRLKMDFDHRALFHDMQARVIALLKQAHAENWPIIDIVKACQGNGWQVDFTLREKE